MIIKIIWILIYNLVFLPILVLLLFILSIFNDKIKKGISGRKNQFKKIKQYFKNVNPDNTRYWFHCASHGEYEQVKPILTGLKELDKNCIIIVSFFSPSGYDNVNDENINLKFYLPLDLPISIFKILSIIKPYKLIFAEYDVWPNLIWIANFLNIHTTIFSARFTSRSKKLLPIIKNFYSQIYSSFNSIYTINETDYIFLKKIINKKSKILIRVLGSPRYDMVDKKNKKNKIDNNEKRPLTIVAGSMWPEDDKVILPVIINFINKYPSFQLIWVPHEPKKDYIINTINYFKNKKIDYELFSHNNQSNKKIIIMDEIGHLYKIYWKSKIAYIGGGFSNGVHNVMESSIANIPTIFGPNYKKSHAAEELVKEKGGFTIKDSSNFKKILTLLLDNNIFYKNASISSSEVIKRNLGSSRKVLRGILFD